MFKSRNEAAPEVEKTELAATYAEQCTLALDYMFGQKRAHGVAMMLYIENFRLFNESFGYAAAESFLGEVLSFLRSLPDARVLRHSGTEFVIVFEKYSMTKALEAADVICGRFEEPWRVEGLDYMCLMTLSLAEFPLHAMSSTELLDALTIAIGETEFRGRNQPVVFDSDLEQGIQRTRGIAKLLRDNLGGLDELIEVKYRPTCRTVDGTFTRADCYPRILSVDFGLICAPEFMGIAEDSGLIGPINMYIIRRACAEIRALIDAGVTFESIAAPVAPLMFLQKSFTDDVRGLMAEYKIPEKKLALEFSESAFINLFSRVNVAMQELSEMGAELVLNEFGTGYSGITNMIDLPVDAVKLERMFIWQLETNPRSAVLVKGLIQIANELGLKLIAEGVETENQLSLLSEYGCPYEQGFYYSATVDAPELAHMLGHKKAE